MREERKVKDQLITCCFIIVTIGVQVNESCIPLYSRSYKR